jgi:3-hydroxyacyl-[acyl-carrier-protein] dehydratase
MLARVEDARFRRAVVPGEQLVIRVAADKVKRGMWWYRCEASVSDQVVASATIICAPGGG